MKKILKWTLIGIFILVFVGSVYAYGSGATGKSKTGCTPCHDATSDSQTTVTITGIPDQYVPGDTYLLTINVTSTSVSGDSGGFDLSVTAGTLDTTDPNAKIEGGEATHKNNNARSWQVNWTAPTEVGSVTFYVAGLASDGTGSGGDEYATNSYSVTTEGPSPEKERLQLWTLQVLIGSLMIVLTTLFAIGIATSRKKGGTQSTASMEETKDE